MLSASLPILGVNGTTRRIGKGTIAQGRCIAKMACPELEKTVASSTYLCGMTLPSHHCR